MKAERVQAAILYAELRNFTRLSEVLPPDKVLQLASDFFTLAAKAATANGGKALPVQNDALAAAFTAGDKSTFAAQALKAAQGIQLEFGALGEKWKTEYGLPAAVSLGRCDSLPDDLLCVVPDPERVMFNPTRPGI